MRRMPLRSIVWNNLGLDEKNLERIGGVQYIPIPDVTMEGRVMVSTVYHAITEGKELEEALQLYQNGEIQAQDLAGEVIDQAIAALSAVHQFRKLFDVEELQNLIVGVLEKNRDRGYYDTESMRHWSECESGSYSQLKEKFSEHIGGSDG